MKKKWLPFVFGWLLVLAPSLVLAAGAPAKEIVVVADTRHLSGFVLYLANLYNENMWLFALWSVILTTALGGTLGVLMDIIMSRSGLDLGKTHKVEH